ncbi:MAG: lipoate--protein ligase family protein [Elusimicrobia bacterium]|nr:lipoate--protein ligase family protein [Elusimicrobiota bacterium]
MRVWRHIFSEDTNPYTNMAVDRAMIDFYRKDSIPLFRIYRWRPHGFSYGYSQNAEEVLDIPACYKDGISFVRRSTGGGIIYHGNEATYSVVCSTDDIGLPAVVKEGYKTICAFILNTYRYYGLNPVFAIDSGYINKKKSTICFASFEDYDILINRRKIGGNAQKRHKKIIMQHGSIPLILDNAPVLKYVKEKLPLSAQQTTDIRSEIGRDISFEEFASVLKECFVKTFAVKLNEKALTLEEKETVKVYEEQLIQEKDYLIGDRGDKKYSA